MIAQPLARFHRLAFGFTAAANQCLAYSRRHLPVYGIVGIASPLITIIDYQIAATQFNTLWIRLLTAIVCVPALLSNHLPRKLDSLLHIYFVLACGIVFPFGFGAMLVLNAAHAPEGTEIHMQWILQYFIALFIYIQVLPNRPLALAIWIIFTLFALTTALLIPEPNLDELKRVLLYTIPAFFTAVGLGILTNRQTDILDTERLKAASAIGASVAHELRTPLASIRALSGGVDRFLPTLVEAYKQAAEAGLAVEPLRPKQVETLKKALHTIQSEVQYSNTIIDMLLVNTADKLSGDPDNESFSVKDCIEEAVNRYPFNNEAERRLIRLRLENDFLLTAPRLLVVHILFNLIKNGLQFVQRKEGASIEISAEQDDECSRISVHDTGPGISYFSLPHVFDRFYSTNRTGQGAGIGLSFCKMVMDQIGGDISCDSVEGEYTTFTLTFPNQRND